jgi:RHS repeat-associated protein
MLLFVLTSTKTTAFAQAALRPCAPITQLTDPEPVCFLQIDELSHGSSFWHLSGLPDHAQAGTAHHFTGKERDTGSGDDYFAVRYEASSMGSFMSPDPSAKPANLQSWNLYGHALNNPPININPTGPDCIYVNDAGNRIESIDHNSNATECGDPKNGGTSVPGYVSEDHAAYNSNTGQFQAASYDGRNVHFARFAAGTRTDAKGNCSSSCSGYVFASADASWLSSMIVGGTLDQMMTFLVDQDVGIHGVFGPSDPGTAMQILSGPFEFWNDHWAGPDGMGTPSGQGDWASIVHDYNYDTNHVTIGMYFNPFISRATAHAIVQSNSKLIRNAGGFQGVKMGLFFGMVNAFQWAAHGF